MYVCAGNGEFIVVLDSMDRENEGDLIIAAEDVTTEKMAFMVRHSRFVRYPANSTQDFTLIARAQRPHLRSDPHFLGSET